MDVEDAVSKRLAEVRRQNFHITGQADEVDAPRFGLPDDRLIVGDLIGEEFRAESHRRKPSFAGRGQSRSVFLVAEDEGDLRLDSPGGDSVGNGHKIGPAARQQDHDPAAFFGAAEYVFAHGALLIGMESL